ncbi:hypothetical protein B0H14DRAFT_2659467 [Mycena olivaceomarginata]|nr:hypothetical protein B0H14DRAFT_2659467 [Mycena olivaceomarginata]
MLGNIVKICVQLFTIHCLAHVINLVVQKLLAALEDLPDPDLVDDYLPNKDLTIHYDPDTDPDVLQMEQEIFMKDDNETTEEDDTTTLMDELASTFANMSLLQKCHKCFCTMAAGVYGNEPMDRSRRRAFLMVVHDARHRWDYMHAMIECGMLLRKANYFYCANQNFILNTYVPAMPSIMHNHEKCTPSTAVHWLVTIDSSSHGTEALMTLRGRANLCYYDIWICVWIVVNCEVLIRQVVIYEIRIWEAQIEYQGPKKHIVRGSIIEAEWQRGKENIEQLNTDFNDIAKHR